MLQFGHLPLATLLQDLVHGNDGAAQVSVFPNTVFHLYLRPFRDDEPVFLQQAHMLGDGIAGEMQDFRRVEHIISASKAPFGRSALVSCRDLKSLTVPKRCRRMSLAAARRSTSCSGKTSHMRKGIWQDFSHRKRDGPQGPSLFLLWLLIGLRSPAGGIAAVDHENSHAYQYQCR